MHQLASLLTIFVLTGCGSDLPQTIRVSGRVTFDGQAPPAPGSVYFLPQEAAKGFPRRPGTGDYDQQGYFKAMTFEPGDGLMPGKYLIALESWRTASDESGKAGSSYLPKKYQSAQTSGFSLDISPNMRPQTVNFDIMTK